MGHTQTSLIHSALTDASLSVCSNPGSGPVLAPGGRLDQETVLSIDISISTDLIGHFCGAFSSLADVFETPFLAERR